MLTDITSELNRPLIARKRTREGAVDPDSGLVEIEVEADIAIASATWAR